MQDKSDEGTITTLPAHLVVIGGLGGCHLVSQGSEVIPGLLLYPGPEGSECCNSAGWWGRSQHNHDHEVITGP